MALANLFYSYSHRDESYRDELSKHLAILRRQNKIGEWHDRRIGPGEDWHRQISTHMESADVILLLVSPDFVASDYCWDVEVARALERHQAGQAVVVPVILRPTYLDGAAFMTLQALPEDAKPISQWPNADEAWVSVARGLATVCERIADLVNEHARESMTRELFSPGGKLYSKLYHTPEELGMMNSTLALYLGRRLTKTVFFEEIDRELGIAEGTTKRLIRDIAARHGLHPRTENHQRIRFWYHT